MLEKIKKIFKRKPKVKPLVLKDEIIPATEDWVVKEI